MSFKYFLLISSLMLPTQDLFCLSVNKQTSGICAAIGVLFGLVIWQGYKNQKNEQMRKNKVHAIIYSKKIEDLLRSTTIVPYKIILQYRKVLEKSIFFIQYGDNNFVEIRQSERDNENRLIGTYKGDLEINHKNDHQMSVVFSHCDTRIFINVPRELNEENKESIEVKFLYINNISFIPSNCQVNLNLNTITFDIKKEVKTI